MPLRRLIMMLLLAALAGSLAACSGGGAKVQSVTTTTTMGQELQDLQDAYDKGIISEKEYQTGKKRIMERYKK